MTAAAPALRAGEAPLRRISVMAWAGSAGLAIAFAGLFLRIMNAPVRHDEQMYLPVGVVLPGGELYSDFGFNNLPNLPWLLHAVFAVSGTDHYLLTGRILIFVAWVAAAAVLALLVRRATGSAAASGFAVLLLLTNPLLLGAAGTLVTNNFLPVPFSLLALHLFIGGVDRDTPHWPSVFASGVCIAAAVGLKANYVFLIPPFAVAALMLPRHATLAGRLRRVTLPLLVGGICGGVPMLAYFAADPAGFLTHVAGYHRGPHIAYWTAHPTLDGPKIMSLAAKAQLASEIWLGTQGVLIVLTVIGLALAALAAPAQVRRAAWPIWLTAALVAGGVVVSFVPTPAFPQYYVPPLPFAIVLAALLYARLAVTARAAAHPFLGAVALVAVTAGAPRLLGDLGSVLHPDRWTGNRMYAAGRQIAAELAADRADGPIATLAPLYAIEAGRPVYRALAAGPMVYRVGDLIPAADRPHYRMVSPTTVGALLDATPPAAILVGYEGTLDDPLTAYANANGYRRVVLPILRDRYGDGVLFVRQQGLAGG